MLTGIAQEAFVAVKGHGDPFDVDVEIERSLEYVNEPKDRFIFWVMPVVSAIVAVLVPYTEEEVMIETLVPETV